LESIPIDNIKKGIYLLEIYAPVEFKVTIKKFRDVEFPAGYYYYVGSAQKNFASRIKRHLRSDKVVHWHIDHVTSINTNEITRIYYLENAGRNVEIELANLLISELNCKIIVERFGCSDSPGSITHLVYRRKQLPFGKLKLINPDIVQFIPGRSQYLNK
jgi:Uri superfamily endonuclease